MSAAPPSTNLRSAAILSPHRDDAAFSSGLLITLLLEHGIPVTIFNVFTDSTYAPFAPPGTSADSITALRRSEDEALLRLLGPGAHLHDLAELDAPLRLGITAEQVLSDALPAQHFDQETHRLAARLTELAGFDLVLLPLALGSHVDHRLARDAGRLAAPPARTAFYQDLPYASRLPLAGRQQRIADHTSGLTPDPLLALDIPHPFARSLKFDLASLYSSQIDPEVAHEIAAYADTLGGAERLYAPAPLAQSLQATLPNFNLFTTERLPA